MEAEEYYPIEFLLCSCIAQTPPRLTIDWQAYLPLLEDSDIPETDKRELIETLWAIMISFVDLGFGLDPVQQSCGQTSAASQDLIQDVLDCSQHPKSAFNQAVAGDAAGKEQLT